MREGQEQRGQYSLASIARSSPRSAEPQVVIRALCRLARDLFGGTPPLPQCS